MRVLMLSTDLVDKNGTLLLAKGTKINITDERYLKYKHLGIFDEKEASDHQSEQKNSNNAAKANIKIDSNEALPDRVSQSLIELSEKFKLNEEVFNRATEIVLDIIHNSKQEKWYMHFITLTGYVDWLFAHSINTALISTIIGIKMAFNNEKLKQVALGALLHDLGLILLSKRILMKPSELNNLEKEIIKSHCELGVSMLEESELSEISKNIILQHHEKLDGSGYPSGLSEGEIYTESRIVMIAESFDSATTERPYKKAKTANTIIEEMQSNPQIYDSNIVKLLNKSILGSHI